MKYDIKKILAVQQSNEKTNAWVEIENKIGFLFPEDYKMFVDFYGEGAINEFLWILSPFSQNENLNLIEKLKIIQESYNSMKNEFPKDYLYNFYDGQKGLFPWGITDNGDELFWNIKEDGVEIIVYASRYSECVKYSMMMEEFLCKLLQKDIVCPIFPDDFILENNYYEKV